MRTVREHHHVHSAAELHFCSLFLAFVERLKPLEQPSASPRPASKRLKPRKFIGNAIKKTRVQL